MNELKFIGKYNSLESLRQAFQNGAASGDFATIKGVTYYWSISLFDWTTDYPGSVFEEEDANDINYLGSYNTLVDVWRMFPNGAGMGNYVKISGSKYFWSEENRAWEIGTGEDIPPGIPAGDPNKFYNEQGNFVYINTFSDVIYGVYIDETHFKNLNAVEVELKENTLYIDTTSLQSYIYVTDKLVKTGISEADILKLFQKEVEVTTYEEITMSSYEFEDKVIKTNGSFTNLQGGFFRGFTVFDLKEVAITGYSPNEGNEHCLAIIKSSSGTIIQTLHINTGQYYDKLIVPLPQYAASITINGFGNVRPMAYEVKKTTEKRWVFYTTEEVDALLNGLKTGLQEQVKQKHFYIQKSGLNGALSTHLFSYPKSIRFTGVKCENNCDNVSVKTGAAAYDKTTLVNAQLNAGAEMQILDIHIKAGFDAGNVRIDFQEL